MVKKPAEGNISFVTGTAGYLLAGEVVRDILVSRKRFTQLTANEKLSADHGQIQFMSISQGGTVMSALQK